MAILMPARTGLEHYEDALADAGIPYRHEGSRDFYQRQEVRDLIWVLAAIDDPTDRLALVGALRSSAFAIDDESSSATAPRRARCPTAPNARARSPPVNDALAELNNLHRMRTRLSLAETVRRVVERTHLVEFALTRPDGDQGAANLLAIVDQARLFAAAGGGGLRPFIRHLRDSMAEEQIEIEATVAEETDDVVRIMTDPRRQGPRVPDRRARQPRRAQPEPRAAGATRAGALPALPRRSRQRRPPRPLQDPRLRRGVGAGEGSTSRPNGCGCCTSPRRAPAST